MNANDARLRRLNKSGGIVERDANPWARCRRADGGAPAAGQGARLRKYIRRLQLEKTVSDSQVREVRMPLVLYDRIDSSVGYWIESADMA